MKYEVGQSVKAVNNEPLEGNEHAPALEIGKDYEILQIVEDKEGNQHLDVGLESELNFIRSYETKEELPDGDRIHWCHPSRFTLNG